MEQIGTHEAKTHLSELLARVRQGEEFLITHRGEPVAKLVPALQASKDQIRLVISEMKEIRERNRLGGLKIREMIEEGRG
jgi:prevent-host-death family protein